MSYASTLGVKSVFSCIWPNMQALHFNFKSFIWFRIIAVGSNSILGNGVLNFVAGAFLWSI